MLKQPQNVQYCAGQGYFCKKNQKIIFGMEGEFFQKKEKKCVQCAKMCKKCGNLKIKMKEFCKN